MKDIIGNISCKYGYCNYEIKLAYTHIYNLFVYPEFRRQGRAKVILTLAIYKIRNFERYTGEIQIVAKPQNNCMSKEKLTSFYESLNLKVFQYYG